MSDPRLDPVLRDALDRFTVPPLSAGFADRVVAAATGPAKPIPLAVPSRRDRRGGWVRGHRVVIGAVAFGLMSAAAAATAIFGDVARTMPVIGPLIASIAPARTEPKAKKPIGVKPAVAKADEPQARAVADAPPIETPLAVLPERREIRREFVAQKIAARLERRAEVRAELGLPPKPPRLARVLPVLRRLPPDERAALVERVREIRQEQREQGVRAPERELLVPDRVPEIAPRAGLPSAPVSDVAVPAGADPQSGEAIHTPERLEQLRRLRAIRELQQRRREIRRQRLQQ